MRRGQFRVTKELMAGRDWPTIEAELNKVFTLEAKEQLPYGVVAFHGLSPFFDEANECSSPEYVAIFKTNDDKKIEFMKFEKV